MKLLLMCLILWIIRPTADRCVSGAFQRLINSRQSVSRQSLVILSCCAIWIPSLQAKASIIKASQARLYHVACPAMKRSSWSLKITLVNPEVLMWKIHHQHFTYGTHLPCDSRLLWGWSRCQRSTNVSHTHSNAWLTGSGASSCPHLFRITCHTELQSHSHINSEQLAFKHQSRPSHQAQQSTCAVLLFVIIRTANH
jgi:hypothetical protein